MLPVGKGAKGDVLIWSVTVLKSPCVLDSVVSHGVSVASGHCGAHCELISGNWRINWHGYWSVHFL